MVFSYGRAGYGFGLLDNGQLILSRIDVDGLLSAAVVADTNWHHVAVTKAGSTAVFYLDGAPASGALSYSTTYTFTESAAVGSRGDARGARSGGWWTSRRSIAGPFQAPRFRLSTRPAPSANARLPRLARRHLRV